MFTFNYFTRMRSTIKANGDVMFCPDEWITEFKLGNIKENNIDQLWNNEQAQKFRSFIIKKVDFQYVIIVVSFLIELGNKGTVVYIKIDSR